MKRNFRISSIGRREKNRSKFARKDFLPEHCSIKQQRREKMTFADLPFYTKIYYNDSCNVNYRNRIIGQRTDQFGTWTELLTQDGYITKIPATTKIDGNIWTIA